MLIEIYHLELTKLAIDKINAGQLKNIHELFLKSGYFGSNEARKNVWDADEEVKKHLSYKHVADVAVDADDIGPALEEAFALTQNVMRSWTENAAAVRWLSGPNLRSSSVGDIFVVDGIRYAVDSVRFDEVK